MNPSSGRAIERFDLRYGRLAPFGAVPAMLRKIVGFHQDEDQHWVAQLECGHEQHVRHDPPWRLRPWVITPEGRAEVLGRTLACRKCDAAPHDETADSSVEQPSPLLSHAVGC